MKVLLDHCVPKRFRQLLTGHEVKTTFEMGWADLKNGELLRAAAGADLEVFVTVDQNLQYEQNLPLLPLAVIILAVPNNRLETLRRFAPEVLAALTSIQPRTLLRIEDPSGGLGPATP